MYRALLVPLDGSRFGEHALPVACAIARSSGATLHLVHVHVRVTPAPIYVKGLPVIDDHLQSLGKIHERTYLESIRNRLTVEPHHPITVTVLDPIEADVHDQTIPVMLASYAATANAGLIVMATHGRGGLARFWLGSVADALIRTSPVPVLLLRPSEHLPPVVEHPRAFRQILIPLDGSALAEGILKPALELGALMQARYTLLYVVVAQVPVPWGPFTTAIDPGSEEIQRHQAKAQHYLDGIARRLLAAGAQVRTRVLIAERPAAAILEDARRHGSELIAMATHGRSGLVRSLLGSTADTVLRSPDRPVLFYRPRARRDRTRYRVACRTADAALPDHLMSSVGT